MKVNKNTTGGRSAEVLSLDQFKKARQHDVDLKQYEHYLSLLSVNELIAESQHVGEELLGQSFCVLAMKKAKRIIFALSQKVQEDSPQSGLVLEDMALDIARKIREIEHHSML